MEEWLYVSHPDTRRYEEQSGYEEHRDVALEIRGSGGTKEHGRYEWDKQDTLDLIVVGFTEGDSTKKIPPETVLTLKNFDKLMGQSGTGFFFFSPDVLCSHLGNRSSHESQQGRKTGPSD